MSGLNPRQRPPSPSNTTYSGISNYRTDSYRPIGKVPAVPSIDSRKIAKIHFDELQKFLGQHLAKGLDVFRLTSGSVSLNHFTTISRATQLAVQRTREADTSDQAAVSRTVYRRL